MSEPEFIILIFLAKVMSLAVLMAMFPQLRSAIGLTSIAIISAVLTHAGVPLSTLIAEAKYLSAQCIQTNAILVVFLTLAGYGLRTVVFAIPLIVAMEAFSMGARIIDVSRGAQFAEQVSPLLESRVSPLESAAGFALSIMVFLLGGYKIVFQAAHTSILAPFTLSFTAPSSIAAGELVLRISSQALAAGFSIGAPAMVLCLLYDVAAGIISSFISPSLVASDLVPLKLVIGLVLGMFSLWFLSDQVSELMQSALIVQSEYLRVWGMSSNTR